MNEQTTHDSTADGEGDQPWNAIPALAPVPSDTDASASGEQGAAWLDWFDGTEDTPASTDSLSQAGQVLAPDQSEDLPADPMAPMVASLAENKQRQAARRARRIRLAAGVGGAAAAATLIGAGVWAFSGSDAAARSAAPSLIPATATVAVAAPPVWCKEIDTPTRVVSSGPGDESTPIGTLVAQQYAWYVLRDATAVRAHLAPDAVAASPEATSAAISALPAGTDHCVTVTALGGDRFDVSITERHPDKSELTWEQIATATLRDGRVLITSIRSAGG